MLRDCLTVCIIYLLIGGFITFEPKPRRKVLPLNFKIFYIKSNTRSVLDGFR